MADVQTLPINGRALKRNYHDNGDGTYAEEVSVTVVAGGGTQAVTQSTSPWVTKDSGLPATLGQYTAANSTGVVLASDQSAIPVTLATGPSPFVPASANLLTNASAGNGATIITIPSGRIFVGKVYAVASHTVAAGGAAANVFTEVVTAGATVLPAAGAVVAAIPCNVPAPAATVTGTAGNACSPAIDVVIYAGASAATLIISTNASAGWAHATGFLI